MGGLPKLADPASIVERWNTHEPSQLFWVDDAFGVTQYESQLAHGWNHILVQVKTILRQGAKIIMTSRDYIYNRARQDLKQSAFPLLSESQVVIDVHDLSNLEKQQILYNHLKLGKQPATFCSGIKPHLEDMAAHPRFIPETARRISEPMFTKNLYLSEYHLGQFVEKREQLLLEVIQGLDASSRAALGLIYMRKDHLESPITLQTSEPLALERLGSTLGDCLTALAALNGSLVANSRIDDRSIWHFRHPTVGDAYARTLTLSSELLGIFLSGSSTENLTSQVTCGDVGVENAVVVPKALFPEMITRLREFSMSDKYKDRWLSSWKARRTLHQFLASRCSKEFLSLYMEEDSDILRQISEPGRGLRFSPEVNLAVRLQEFGSLPEEIRVKIVSTVSQYAIEGQDVQALDDGVIRNIFTDKEFEHLVSEVRVKLVPRLEDIRASEESSHDPSEPPDEHMQDMLEMLFILEKQFSDDEAAVKTIRRETELANEWVAEIEPPELEVSPRVLGSVEPSEKKCGTRSVFDDIDDGAS